MKTLKLVLAATLLVALLPSPSRAQTLSKGIEYQPQPANPCHANTTCGWVASSGQVQFFDGVTATAKTIPSIVTSAKGDVAVWNGTAWQKFARCPDGQVMAADAAAASGWVCATAGGTQTLAQTYAAGAAAADSRMSLNPTAAGVEVRDNATPLGTFLFRVSNSAGTSRYLDVLAASVQILFNGVNAMLAVDSTNATFGVNAVPLADATQNLGAFAARWLHAYLRTGSVRNTGLGATSVAGNGFQYINDTPASGGVHEQWSPMAEFQGSSFFGEAPGTEKWAIQLQPSYAGPSATKFAIMENTGTYTTRAQITEHQYTIPDAINSCTSTLGMNSSVPVGSTRTPALSLANLAAAANGLQQYSPGIELSGQGYKSGAPAASQNVRSMIQQRTVQASDVARGYIDFLQNVNGGGYVHDGAIGLDIGFNGQGISLISANYNGSNTGFAITVNNSQINLYDVNGARAIYFGGPSVFQGGGVTLGDTSNRWPGTFAHYYDTRAGSQLTAAASITPVYGVHHVVGATTIDTIALTNFTGNPRLTLIADGGTITWSAAGNVKAAGTIAQDKMQVFQYVATDSKWYAQQ